MGGTPSQQALQVSRQPPCITHVVILILHRVQPQDRTVTKRNWPGRIGKGCMGGSSAVQRLTPHLPQSPFALTILQGALDRSGTLHGALARRAPHVALFRRRADASACILGWTGMLTRPKYEQPTNPNGVCGLLPPSAGSAPPVRAHPAPCRVHHGREQTLRAPQ